MEHSSLQSAAAVRGRSEQTRVPDRLVQEHVPM